MPNYVSESLAATPDDASVVRQVLDGARDAYGLLVERYIGCVHGVCFAASGNHADAEDFTQDIFLKAYLSLDRLRESERFAPWLFTIAKNHARSAMRARMALKRIEPAFRDTPSPPDFESAELHELLRRKVSELDDTSREALMLHYFAGNSIREIAAMLDISKEAAAKRIQRARESLSQNVLTELEKEIGAARPVRDQIGRIMGVVALASPTWHAAKFSMRHSMTGDAAGGKPWLGLGATKVLAVTGIVVAVITGAWLVRTELRRTSNNTASSTPLQRGPDSVAVVPQASAPSTPESTARRTLSAVVTQAAQPSSNRPQLANIQRLPTVHLIAPAAKATAPAAAPDAPPIGDMREQEPDTLMESIRAKFWAGSHGELEDFAHWARTEGACTPSGVWKLAIFYDAFRSEYEGREVADRYRVKRMVAQWLKLFPESITPRVVKLNMAISDAWKERGRGWAYTVTDLQWLGFRNELTEAKEIAGSAAGLGQFDPELNAGLITLAMASNGPKEDAQRLFDEGVAKAPTYRQLYEAMVMYLLPRWHGQRGDLLALAERSVELTKQQTGQAMYFFVARSAVWDEDAAILDSDAFDYTRVVEGFEDYKRIYTWGDYDLNVAAYASSLCGDAVAARRTFALLGDRYNPVVWNRHAFAACRAWAIDGAPLPNRTLVDAEAEPGTVVDVNRLDQHGNTILAMACARKNWARVASLIEAGADPDTCDTDDKPVIFTLLEFDQRPLLKRFAEYGAEMNLGDGYGQTIAHAATRKSNIPALRFLIDECHVNPDIPDREGMTPLIAALREQDEEMAAFLISEKADPDRTSAKGWTPLQYATYYQLAPTVSRLVEAGADVLAMNKDGWSPLHDAAGLETPEILRTLLKAPGADINLRRPDGATPLYVACLNENRDMVKAILEDPKCDLELGRENYGSPLLVASSRGNLEIAKLLIDRGADIHRPGKTGVPLVFAAFSGNVRLVRYLLERGCDANEVGPAKTSALAGACESSPVEMLDLLIDAGADVNHREDDGWTALHMAVMSNNMAALRRLWVVPNIDTNPSTKEGRNLLHTAARAGHIEIAKFLIENGANINARDGKGRSPLAYAIERRKNEMADYLRRLGGTE